MHCIGGQNIKFNLPKKSKKKTPKNAFSFFLDEVFLELRKKNTCTTKAQAVPQACEKWKKMTLAEKKLYENKAKEWKIMNKNQPRPGRLDCTGKLIDGRVNMDELLEKKRKEIRKKVRSTWPPGAGVCDEHFYIISFQSLFEFPDEEGYQPCEVACVDYTLNFGIVREWHKFIDPGPVKLGLGAEVKIFREKTHQIPEKGFEYASNQYDRLWRDLLQFIKPDRRSASFPPLYTRMSELRKTEFSLQWMSSMAGIANQLHEVYELEDVAAELFYHAGIERPSLFIIEAGCSSSMYDYEMNTKCHYHDEIECIYCALLVVKKCCYWMSDALCKIYRVDITDKHLPVRRPPTYVVTPPESLVIDERPRRHMGPRVNPLSKESGFRLNAASAPAMATQNNQTYTSRDIRYRCRFELAPHPREDELVEDSDDDDSTVEASDTATETESTVSVGDPVPAQRTVRRPLTQPSFAAKQGVVLAASFQRSVKLSDATSTSTDCGDEVGADNASGDGRNTLPKNMEAESISDANPDTPSENSDESSVQSLKMRAFGLGRGRGWRYGMSLQNLKTNTFGRGRGRGRSDAFM